MPSTYVSNLQMQSSPNSFQEFKDLVDTSMGVESDSITLKERIEYWLIETLEERIEYLKGFFEKSRKLRDVCGASLMLSYFNQHQEVVKYIHSQRVIHRDIKPSDIICRKTDRKIYEIDFGRMALRKPEKRATWRLTDAVTRLKFYLRAPVSLLCASVSTLNLVPFDLGPVKQVVVGVATEQSVVLGTPNFAPPEQLTGRAISSSSDLYSLAATCVCLLTGRHLTNPLRGGNRELLTGNSARISPVRVASPTGEDLGYMPINLFMKEINAFFSRRVAHILHLSG